jgi:hypothetical protein
LYDFLHHRSDDVYGKMSTDTSNTCLNNVTGPPTVRHSVDRQQGGRL